MKKYLVMFFATLTFSLLMCVGVYASEFKPPINSLDENYDAYLVTKRIYAGATYYRLVLYNSSDWSVIWDSNYNLVWTKNRETAYVRYYKEMEANQYDPSGDNGGWGTLQQLTGMEHTAWDIYYGNQTLYDENGKLVFHPTHLLKEKTTEALTTLSQEVGGVMNILVLCGVGCLACLTVLSLFGRHSLIFRH